MVKKKYVPNQGDIVWLELGPTRGHEQSGRRPALVLSPKKYNGLVGLMLICPITSKSKGYAFEVPLGISKIIGVVLSDQVRSLDWKTRRVAFIERIDESAFARVISNIKTLLNQS